MHGPANGNGELRADLREIEACISGEIMAAAGQHDFDLGLEASQNPKKMIQQAATRARIFSPIARHRRSRSFHDLACGGTGEVIHI
jgi:hypothetical protein